MLKVYILADIRPRPKYTTRDDKSLVQLVFGPKTIKKRPDEQQTTGNEEDFLLNTHQADGWGGGGSS